MFQEFYIRNELSKRDPLKGDIIASNSGPLWVGDNTWFPGFNGKIDNI
jgi:hypothetical protein